MAPGIGHHFGKTFALYRFLQAHKGEADLATRVLRNGTPLFTKRQLQTVLRGLPTAQQRLQRGGASAGTGLYDKLFNKLVGAVGALPSFSSLSSLSGPSALTLPCSDSLQTCIAEFPGLPYVKEITELVDKALFLLHTLETDIPILGPAVFSPAFDAVTLGIPAAEGFVEAGLHSVAVVPGIGSFAVIAATIVGPLLAVLATVLNLSRKQFGSAFQTSLAIVPSVGDALMEASQQAETFLKRLQERLDKVLIPVKEISPTAGMAAQQYVPSFDVYTGPAVPLTMATVDKIKAEVMATLEKKATENPAVANALRTVREGWATIVAAVPPTMMAKLNAGDVQGTLREVMTIAQLPPAQLMATLGVPPEVRTLGERALQTASNLKTAAVALATTGLPLLSPSLTKAPVAATTQRRRRSRRWQRRNTRRRR